MTGLTPLPPPFPPCCWYNLNYLSLSARPAPGQRANTDTRRNQKLRNVTHLASQNSLLGFSELHVSEGRAEACFFQHVPSLSVYYHTRHDQPGLAIGVNTKYGRGKDITHEIVHANAAHCVHWTEGDIERVFLNIRLTPPGGAADQHSQADANNEHPLPGR